MVAGILSHTPPWVWLLLVALFAWGLRQTRPHQASLRRITRWPVVMAVLSLYSATPWFAVQPWGTLAWLGAMVVALGVMVHRPLAKGTQFSLRDNVFFLPGSWGPMTLLLSLFCTHYAASVATAIAPELLQTRWSTLLLSGGYGLLSGLLLGRALRLWRLARHTEAQWHGQAIGASFS